MALRSCRMGLLKSYAAVFWPFFLERSLSVVMRMNEARMIMMTCGTNLLIKEASVNLWNEHEYLDDWEIIGDIGLQFETTGKKKMDGWCTKYAMDDWLEGFQMNRLSL